MTWELYSYLELPAFKLHLNDKRKVWSLNIVKDESFSVDRTDKIRASRLPAYVSLPPSAVKVHFGLSHCLLMYNFLLLSTSGLRIGHEIRIWSVCSLFLLGSFSRYVSLRIFQGCSFKQNCERCHKESHPILVTSQFEFVIKPLNNDHDSQIP